MDALANMTSAANWTEAQVIRAAQRFAMRKGLTFNTDAHDEAVAAYCLGYYEALAAFSADKATGDGAAYLVRSAQGRALHSMTYGIKHSKPTVGTKEDGTPIQVEVRYPSQVSDSEDQDLTWDSIATTIPSAAEDAAASEESKALARALPILSDRDREIITRRFFAEDTLDAIAQDMGLTKQRVKQLEDRALETLRQEM